MLRPFLRSGLLAMAAAVAVPGVACADSASDLAAALSAMRARDYERAVDLYTVVLTGEDLSTESSYQAYRGRGNAYHELRRFRLSIADYSRAIDLRPGIANSWNSRCWSRIYIGQPRAAIEDCDMALTLNPKFGAAFDSRAVAYAAAGDYARALEDHKRAIERDPLAEHYYNRGLTYERQGDRDAATKDFATARSKATDEAHWERIEREMEPLRKRTTALPPTEPRRPDSPADPDSRQRK